jgi:hypothetical protein
MSKSPCKNVRLIIKHASIHSAPALLIRLTAAVAVPPVAIRSSISRTFGFDDCTDEKASIWMHTSSTPYSREYFSLMVV